MNSCVNLLYSEVFPKTGFVLGALKVDPVAVEKARAAASAFYSSAQPAMTTASLSPLNLSTQPTAVSLAAALTQSRIAAAAVAACDLNATSPLYRSPLYPTSRVSPSGNFIDV